jgi:hypothetical protein
MKTLWIGAGCLALGLSLLAAPAAAEERVCRGTIGAVTLDNILVPQGARCFLNGTRAKGTVKVSRSAQLSARGVIVIGNVQAEGAANVNVHDGSRIGGSIQVKQGTSATVANSHVNGDILYDTNRGVLRIQYNRVGGNVQAFQNVSRGLNITRNVIDGNLQCKANRPAPTGGGNVVGGNKEDQCARL